MLEELGVYSNIALDNDNLSTEHVCLQLKKNKLIRAPTVYETRS